MNAIFNQPYFKTSLLVLVIALLVWWWPNEPDTAPAAKEITMADVASKEDYSSDYTMNDFVMTMMDEHGKPSRVITGSTLRHYPKDDSTLITAPISEFTNEQQETWVVTADNGKTQGKGDVIHLTDNVVIRHKEDRNMTLETSILTLNTSNSTAYTDAAVTIITPYGETNSVGLHATLEDETINLHSRVKGHYDAPPSD